jgi:hypothetical protein
MRPIVIHFVLPGWTAPAALAAVHVLGTAGWCWHIGGSRMGLGDATQFVAMGWLLSQVALASFWAAFGPLPFLWRLPLSFLVAMGAGAGMLLTMFEGNYGDPTLILLHLGAAVATWTVLTTAFCLVRLTARISLVDRDASLPAARTRSQFSIRSLLVLTLEVALVLAAARLFFVWVQGLPPQVTNNVTPHIVKMLSVWLGASVLLGLAVNYGPLADRRVIWRIAAALLLAVLVTKIERYAYVRAMSVFATEWIFWCMNGAYLASVLGSLFVLRWSGFRCIPSAAGRTSVAECQSRPLAGRVRPGG